MVFIQKNIFLLDGIGALLSALSAAFVLPLFAAETGLPQYILCAIATVGLTYATYSLSCFFFVKKFKLWLLSFIIAANALYILVSLYFIITLTDVTIFGKTYLLAESIILIFVVFLEASVYRKFYKNGSTVTKVK